MACCCCAASAEVEVVSIAMQLVEVGGGAGRRWKDRFALGIFWEKPMCKTAVALLLAPRGSGGCASIRRLQFGDSKS